MKNQKRFYTSAKGDVLGFYVSFVKMQLCVAKMQLCSDFYTSMRFLVFTDEAFRFFAFINFLLNQIADQMGLKEFVDPFTGGKN